MEKTKKRTKQHYPKEFKDQAVELAKEVGIVDAAKKLGIKKYQTLASWVRYSKKLEENQEFRELEEAKAEIKKLKKQAEEDKKVIAILKDATAFFCQGTLK